MAVSSTQAAITLPWMNAKNAFAAYSGLHINSYWEGWINSNNNVDRKPISDEISAAWITGIASYTLFTSFSQIEYTLLSPERVTADAYGYFPDPRGPYFYAALLLAALTVAKVFKEYELNQPPPLEADNAFSRAPAHHQPPPALTTMDKFIVVVSKATPYLMIITNIAVTIIQIRRGASSAWIKLAFISITLIDITPWKPKDYKWYIDTVLGYPAAAAALYYGNDTTRLNILCQIAFSHKIVREMILEPYMNWLQNILGSSAEDSDDEDD
jgi:hypothetical protein